MLVCLEFGFRRGIISHKRNASPHEGLGAIEAAVFGLLGLLLGFSFAVGASRLDARRQLAISEANAIGTAYLRIDLLPTENQREIRKMFRDYLDARLRVYRALPDFGAAEREIASAAQIQNKIWTVAVRASQADSPQNSTRMLLLPAINEMIDITTPRTVALYTRTPRLILALLIAVALLTSLLAGFAMSKRGERSYLHAVSYSLTVVLTIYTVLDLENPRAGLIQLTEAETAMTQLYNSIR